MPAALGDVPAEPVGEGAAVVQTDGRPHLAEARHAHHAAGGEGGLPFDQVLHGGHHSVVRGQLGLRDAPDVDELAVADRVAGGPVLEDLPLVDHGGRGHAEGTEEALVEKVGVALAAHVLDDHAEQEVAHVAVLEPLARGKAERVLGRRVEELHGRVVQPRSARPERLEVFLEPGQSRGVGEQVAHRDRAPGRGALGQVPEDGIVELDLALFHQLHDARRRELLRHRGQLEHGVWRHGHVVVEIGEAVALHLDDGAVPDHREGEPGDPPLLHLGLDVVVDAIRPGGRGHGERQDHERQDGDQRAAAAHHRM